MHMYNSVEDVRLPKLDDGEYYLYVLKNSPQGNIKIGRTKDIMTRLKSLSGSNTGGNILVKIAVSDPTYLYTLEGLLHLEFKNYRIPGTEWFTNLDFSRVCDYINQLFSSSGYHVCNKVRKTFYENCKFAHNINPV